MYNILALQQENISLLHAINKGADKPVHPHSLTSAFVIRFLPTNDT